MTSQAAGNRRTVGRLASAFVAVVGITACAIARPVEADEAATTVQAFPPSVSLSTAQDRQSMVVQLIEASGITRDLTKDAALTLADPAVARIEGSTLFPLADGDTTLEISAGGQTLLLPRPTVPTRTLPTRRRSVLPVRPAFWVVPRPRKSPTRPGRAAGGSGEAAGGGEFGLAGGEG